MANNVKLSVIIPTYNAGKTINEAVLSVLQQTYPDIELLVIDGASSDDTLTILKKLQQQHTFTFVSEKDKGVYDAMNKGISMARGEWIYFLGADDKFHNNTIVFDFFSLPELDKYDLWYGDILLKTSRKRYGGQFTIQRLLLENIPHQGMFFKKSMFERFGYYNLKYKILADYVFNLSWFADKKVKRGYFDEIVAEYAEEGMSTLKKDFAYKKDRTLLAKQYFGLYWYLYALIAVPLLNKFKNQSIGSK